MAGIEITKTELVWPGKYDEDGNLVAIVVESCHGDSIVRRVHPSF
jgi:hypothetical protein